MNLYVDDDSVRALLLRLIAANGHNVSTPTDAGLVGSPDPVHFKFAIDRDLVLLTHNHDDFNDLHELIASSRGHHPGILVVRCDNDISKDMTPKGIAHAIQRIVAARVTFQDSLHILNHWR